MLFSRPSAWGRWQPELQMSFTGSMTGEQVEGVAGGADVAKGGSVGSISMKRTVNRDSGQTLSGMKIPAIFGIGWPEFASRKKSAWNCDSSGGNQAALM